MPTLTIKTNVSQATDVLIKDMGILIPNSGGSAAFTDSDSFFEASTSKNLKTYVTDNAFGANSSTLILADGGTNIAQVDATNFLLQLGGGTRTIQSTVDFGFASGQEGDIATVTVTTTFATTSSIITCVPFAGTTPDHDPDDPVIEAITVYATNIVDGVSFDLVANAPQNSWGRYLINSTLV